MKRDKNGQPIIAKFCSRCESEFEGVPWQKYCSKICANQQLKVNDAGDRWIIFNRDTCRCIYCGVKSCDAELRPDHIMPVIDGGNDTASNLVTACFQCNLGKGSKILTKATMEYVTSEVKRRNERDGIQPDQKIKGMHESRRRKTKR